MAKGDKGDRGDCSVNLYVANTHTLFWYFTTSPSLGAQAHAAFNEANQGQALIYIPAIVLAELYFLNEKKGRPIEDANTALETARKLETGRAIMDVEHWQTE